MARATATASPRVVFDTNVLISAFRFPGSVSEKAFTLCLSGVAVLVTSGPILDEFEGVLERKFKLPPREVQAIRAFVEQVAEYVEPTIVLDVVEADPDDNAILECAVWGRADYLVTGDKAHLWPLDPFRGIRILGPRQFVSLFS